MKLGTLKKKLKKRRKEIQDTYREDISAIAKFYNWDYLMEYFLSEVSLIADEVEPKYGRDVTLGVAVSRVIVHLAKLGLLSGFDSEEEVDPELKKIYKDVVEHRQIEIVRWLALYFKKRKHSEYLRIFAKVNKDLRGIDEDLKKLFGKRMKIRIVKIPEGPAPKEIKEKWIGVIIEGARFPTRWDYTVDPFTNEVKKEKRKSISVPRDKALEALALVSPKAADWFHQNFDESFKYLSFGIDEVEIILDGPD